MNPPSEFGAAIFVTGASGNLAELQAIRTRVGDFSEFRRICCAYCDVSTGRRVLHMAAEMGHYEICKFLIEDITVLIDVLTYKGDTPLMLAVKEEHVKVVEYLSSQGARIRVWNSKGFTPLHYAVKKDNLELIKLMLENGALIEADSVDGTPLQCAASLGSVEAVKFLLKNKAEPNVVSLVFGSPLICAIKAHSLECMELLLKAEDETEADPNKLEAGSPLKKRRTEIEKAIITSPLGLNPKADSQHLVAPKPPLSKEHMQAEFDPNILEAGAQLKKRRTADPNRFYFGLTPLAHATKEGDTKYLKCLIEAGANPNLPSTDLMKPIEHAALVHNLEGVELLFPLTQPIPHYPNWTVDGIMNYCHSEEAHRQREESRKSQLEEIDAKCKLAESDKDYITVLKCCCEGAYLDPSNPKWLSKRSMCHAHNDKTVLALRDAKKSYKLNPLPPKMIHHRSTANASDLFKKYLLLALQCMLFPDSQESGKAFRVALFEYFSWMYLMSNPVEMMLVIGKFL